ncbi:hypothetical protein NDU88_006377 [Pleurodeles waltl]|uniref:Uncharacterized protein n=1 Tax=Pleurodeles waltl TaxID=8319 RepID=A0AAV7TX02_PLEWA|nr:hypothetical protein NDU88_006377 [Pleurodeles waltl]
MGVPSRSIVGSAEDYRSTRLVGMYVDRLRHQGMHLSQKTTVRRLVPMKRTTTVPKYIKTLSYEFCITFRQIFIGKKA